MLAACTKNALFVLDATTLKNPPTTVPVTTSLSQRPTASAWAADNSCLYVAGSNDISKFSPTGYLYSSTIPLSRPPTALITKDNGDTLIYTSGNEIALLQSTTGQELSKLDLQDQDATLLSLSQDETLIAVCLTSGEVQVHNLSSGTSPVVLRGINGIGEEAGRRARYNGEVTALAFHAHSPTQLLLALGPRLLVYDTIQPARPAKVFLLNKLEGKLVSIACSPFSKTLIAVASSTGKIWLVDIAKDSGPFRTVSLHATITCMTFSAEGAALHAGTDDGRLLTVDLRALDKPAKAVTLSESSLPIICLSIQRKLNTSSGPPRLPSSKPTPSAMKRRNATPTDRDGARAKKIVPPSPSTPGLTSPTATTRPPRTRTISSTNRSATPAKTVPKTGWKTSASPAPAKTKPSPPTPSGSGSRSRKVSIESPPPLPSLRSRTTSGTSASAVVTSPSSRTTGGSMLSRTTSITSVSSPISRKPSRTGLALKRNPVTPPPPSKSPRKPTGQDTRSKDVNDKDQPIAGSSALLVSPRRTRTISESAVVASTPARAPSNSNSRTFSGPTTSTSRPRPKPTPQNRKDTNANGMSLRSPPATNVQQTRPRTISARSASASAAAAPSLPKSHLPPQQRTSAPLPLQPLTVSPIPPMPPLPGDEQLTAINMKWATVVQSRTPSPDFGSLPVIPGVTVTSPAKSAGATTRKGLSEMETIGSDVLGLGLSELRRQIRAEQRYDVELSEEDGKEKETGGEFTDLKEEEEEEEEIRKFAKKEAEVPESEVVIENIEVIPDNDEAGTKTDPGIRMVVHITPRHPSEGRDKEWPSAGSPYTILKNPQSPYSSHPSHSNTNPTPAPQEMLHALLRDALYDFRREVKSDMIGLHLDIVRMGRGWRKEMREVVGEVRGLREENERLRGEVERLRGG